MRAVCWEGKEKIRVETVIKVTTTAICGSDLHIYDGYIPTMQKGDVLGHEFMGEVVEVKTTTVSKPATASASAKHRHFDRETDPPRV